MQFLPCTVRWFTDEWCHSCVVFKENEWMLSALKRLLGHFKKNCTKKKLNCYRLFGNESLFSRGKERSSSWKKGKELRKSVLKHNEVDKVKWRREVIKNSKYEGRYTTYYYSNTYTVIQHEADPFLKALKNLLLYIGFYSIMRSWGRSLSKLLSVKRALTFIHSCIVSS